MTTLYIAAYRVPLNRRRPPHLTPTAAAFYETVLAGSFPYDVGDDPSFFASAYHNGPVTWGVCRPDVRCNIQVGDWVAFFSAEPDHLQPSTTHYRFIDALCVEKKFPHTSLFAPGVPFAAYLNLLLRPQGLGWEHYEPGLGARDWHGDWMWRIICGRRKLRKKYVIAASKHHSPGAPLMLDDQPLPVKDNYIVFSRDGSFAIPQRPIVATHRSGEDGETWQDDRLSRKIREIIFGDSDRGLRTSNLYQPHRHVRRVLTDPSWRQSLQDVLCGRT